MDLAMAQRLVNRRKAAGLSQEAADDADCSEDSDAGAEASDEAEEDEDSADNTSRSDKPLVDISLARGIHVIDPDKGEEVHVGWSGIHVTNERKGEEVHVGPGGVHVDTLEDDGHSVHTNADGTVTIDGEMFSSWKEAHDKLDHHGKHFHTKLGRAWNKFPFPALVALAYLALGIVYGTWGMGLFLVFLIPIYYAIGDFIDRRHLSKLVGSVYPAAAIAWFLYMWLCLGQPHPAWVILVTIPVVGALMHWCRKQWKHRN